MLTNAEKLMVREKGALLYLSGRVNLYSLKG